MVKGVTLLVHHYSIVQYFSNLYQCTKKKKKNTHTHTRTQKEKQSAIKQTYQIVFAEGFVSDFVQINLQYVLSSSNNDNDFKSKPMEVYF